MKTDITELAQRDKFEALLSDKPFHARYMHWSNTLNAYDYTGIQLAWEAYQAGGAELVEALEKAQQVDEELCKLLPPGAEYMDPPDGGDVTPLEGVRRMVADYRQRIAELEPFRTAYMKWSDKTDWVQTDKRFDVLKPWGMHRADVLKAYIVHLESRTATIEPFRSFVTDADLAALHRFAECCDDPESGGHDLEKEQVRRLEEIGALRRSGRVHWITGFGDVLISITAGIKVEAE
ncbi:MULTISPECIES: hypothetical protein [Klebsiella]|uniref:hypothetical protein n=1 Tax=Klebsiella TaxID=570 RepID=UPI00287F2EE4|nr:hypothetical protein [Klebsiella michiganensis]MDS7764314.1 hypothetical protein [Klebsiella michiganensis]HBW1146264.1 hypothetical protein [Klebsiella pneumoniae]